MKRVLVLLATFLLAAPAMAAPSLVIGGTIVTPQDVVSHGWLVIDDGKIAEIARTRPSLPGVHVLETDDLVFPGFIDLHNHPLWAVFPRFQPKPPPPAAPWPNRYAWRADPRYHAALQDRFGELLQEGEFCDMDEFAELQALMGGTTSLVGLDLPGPGAPPTCISGLARNLDYASGFYGAATGHERLAWVLGVFSDMHFDAGRQVHDGIANGGLDLAVVHTAEGRRSDPESRAEFTMLKSWGLLGPHTAVVHGVALGAGEFAEMAKAGTALVWSPRSNMELYGETADVALARKDGIVLALAPDWAPTGSQNMLAEIGYAAGLGKGFSPRDLFEMATASPARIARLESRIGALEKGRYADLFLLKGDSRDPYQALVHAAPQDVTLTMVDGKPIYGARDHLAALGVSAPEMIAVCGQPRGFNPAVLPKPYVALVATLKQKMLAHGVRLAPIVTCKS
ncbi:MAG TPA: amidohydrolase family protein [Rhizomicrobium sp.]|nr:amidohydrolase family protein [Rhizomicrobium sp.]